MFSRYKFKWGLVFSFSIAVLAAIPALIRQNGSQFLFNLVMLIVPFQMCWLIHHFFLLKDFERPKGRPAGYRVALSILVGTLVVIALSVLRSELASSWDLEGVRPGPVLGVGLFRAAVMSAFSYFVVYYLQVNIQLQRSRLENEYLKQDQLKAQLFSLQQQLSPHFLFNSLSTLRTIAPDAETKKYVMQLANVYRYLLTFHDSRTITLGDELAFTRSYLYILHERYEDALAVSIEIEAHFLDYFLPPVTLQILIENALKHNVVSREEPLKLRIYTGEDATLTIENSYQPKLSVEGSYGTGLQNINDRYRLLAGKGISVRQEASLFTVILPLLKE